MKSERGARRAKKKGIGGTPLDGGMEWDRWDGGFGTKIA